MIEHNCTYCRAPVGNKSRIRLVGRDRRGNTVEVCSRCWIEQQRQAEARKAREESP